jgi:hypothetical protein
MNDNVRRARLPRELKVLAVQHMPVKTETELHGLCREQIPSANAHLWRHSTQSL